MPEVGVQYWSRLRSLDYHMLHYHFGKEDPMIFYYSYLHTDPAEPYNGYSPALGVKDPVLDDMLDAVAAEDDFAKRRELFKKVVLRTQEKAYILPYVSPVNASVWSSRLKNYNPLDYFTPENALVEAWLEA